jgi:DNA-binding beta-propeller fold protein YncE
VSTIDVKTRTRRFSDIPIDGGPFGAAVTPDGKTAFVTNNIGGTVSAIDVKTRTSGRRSPDRPSRSRKGRRGIGAHRPAHPGQASEGSDDDRDDRQK